MAAVEDDMQDEEAGEETAFVQEDVLAIIKDSVDGVLANATYSHTKVKQWTSMVRSGRAHNTPLSRFAPRIPKAAAARCPAPATDNMCPRCSPSPASRSALRTASKSSRSSISRSNTL